MNFFYDIYDSIINIPCAISEFFFGNTNSCISSGLISEEQGSSILVENKINETKDHSCSSGKCTHTINNVKIIKFTNEDEEYNNEYNNEESEYQPDSKKVYPYFSNQIQPNNNEINIRLPMSNDDDLNTSNDIENLNQYSNQYIQEIIEQKNSNQFNIPEHSPIKNSTENQNEEEYQSSEVL